MKSLKFSSAEISEDPFSVHFVPGGPLFEGDIEDFQGRPHIVCPWHGYMYDVKSGEMNFIPELKVSFLSIGIMPENICFFIFFVFFVDDFARNDTVGEFRK